MGIAERKEKHKSDLKRIIIDAALKILIQEGFQNLSLRKIASAINYSPTIIYLYFKDKNDILYHIREYGFAKLSEYTNDTSLVSSPKEQLKKMLNNYIEFAQDFPDLYDTMFIEKEAASRQSRHQNSNWSSVDSFLKKLKSILHQCFGLVFTKSSSVETIALCIWSTAHGLILLHLRNRLDSTLEKNAITLTIQNTVAQIIDSFFRVNKI